MALDVSIWLADLMSKKYNTLMLGARATTAAVMRRFGIGS
jgi:hypothetical protein